jgi:hypothetical protein
MDGVLNNIAIIVETGLNDAKAEIALGKQDVQTYVDSLPIDLQDVGQQAADKIQSQFDDLEQQVNDKQGELVDALAKKYHDNLQKLDARIEEMKAANRGLIDKALGAIVGVIKTILALKDMLLNVLARAAAVIGTIISDPIGFLGNLVSGVMMGLENFMANLGQHLKKGLMEWLFGALGEAGIEIPDSFDFKGILSLVLQILGLTYANIRARAVNIVGEPVVKRIEQTVEIFKILITEGPAGLWNMIQEQVDNLKDVVLDGIESFIKEKVLIAGITWIISLLNPASAFIKACKAIYDIVMFFVQRGSQILALVNAVLDSVTAIAQGSLGAAAAAVENALAKAIPVAIAFLASLLGLGGISDKIRAIIEKVRAPVNRAIDWIINKAVQLAKAVGRKLGLVKEDKVEAKEKVEPTPHEQIINRALAEIDQTAEDATTAETIAKKKTVAVQIIDREEVALEPGLKFTIQLQDEAKAKAEGRLIWEAKIAPNDVTNTLEEELDPPYQIEGKPGVMRPENLVAGRMLPAKKQPSTRPAISYVATVPSTPGKNPVQIAQLYGQQGFENGYEEALERFSLVIGINTYENLDKDNDKSVNDTVASISWSEYPLAIFGFVWMPLWREKGGSNVGIEEVREKYFHNLEKSGKDMIRQYEQKNATSQAVIPYGRIRDFIKNSRYTNDLVKALQSRSNEVYLHIGDDDAVSFMAPQGKGIQIDANKIVFSLFSRYDSVLEERKTTKGEYPAIASGGYEFRLKIEGGDVTNENELTAIASQLDLAIRTAMAGVDPETVYFPEPNTLIRVDESRTYIHASFGGGAQEGQSIVKDMIRRRGMPDIVFDRRAVIATSSKRFTLEGGNEVTTPVTEGRLKEFTSEDIQSLFNLTQSHAKARTWNDRVISKYPDVNVNILNQLRTQCFPNEAIGTDPDRLRAELTDFDPTSKLTLAEKQLLHHNEDFRKEIINLAEFSGEAIREFLLSILKPE